MIILFLFLVNGLTNSSQRFLFCYVKEWMTLFKSKHKHMNVYPHFVETDVGVGRQLRFFQRGLFYDKLLHAHDGTLFCINKALQLQDRAVTEFLSERKKGAILTFSLLFPPQPERRARPGSRDALQLRAEARGSAQSPAEKWLLHWAVLRPRAGCRARATPSPLIPYHEAGESPKPGLDLLLGRYRGQPGSRVHHPRAREQKADSSLAASNSKTHS